MRIKYIDKLIPILTAKAEQTTGDLAQALGLSTSRTREILGAEVKAGTITRKHIDEDGTKVFAYSLAEAGKAGDAAADLLETTPTKAKGKGKKAKVVKAPKEKKARKTSDGRGHPEAKKAINPQNTLEMKKAMVREIGGQMVWAERLWHFNFKGGTSVTLASREVAAHTVESLKKALKAD